MTERIIRKTEEFIERPFTTQPKQYVKRGCSTVRSRCMFFVDYLRAMGYTVEIPLEKAKDLFNEILGVYDRTTMKAYFGTLPGRSTRLIRRLARYQTGTFSFKNIELTQDIKKTKGYMEKLGMVTYECHGKVWFMVLENLEIVPQLVKANSAIDKISLIPFTPKGKEFEKTDLGGCLNPNVVTRDTINNNNLQSERDISFSHELCLEAYCSIPVKPNNLPKNLGECEG